MTPKELEKQLNKTLRPWDYRDFCHNGLQVDGSGLDPEKSDDVQFLMTAVTISDAVIDEAIKRKCDAILVHHGWLWKPENGTVTGNRAKQMNKLLNHGISLFAYHLPLDMHEEYGNNVQLMKEFGVEWNGRRFGPDKIAFGFSLPEPMGMTDFLNKAFDKLSVNGDTTPFTLVANDKYKPIRNIAVVTGGGQRFLTDMINQGNYDLFISGEVNLPQHYEALENDVAIVAMGHHRTERYGVKAIGEMLEANTDICVEFYDDGCPL
mgnify:CR=1 FL=1